MRAGDHDLVLLEVLSIDSSPESEAMVFHRSRFRTLAQEQLHV